MMSAKALDLIASGIEPVDKLLGGLERGQLYLAHGEASGKSLFGIQFLIEGLKRGETCALVTRYAHEDAVRRFARLGYDCLTDVQEGRLVILQYCDDIPAQLKQLPELTPVLRELEWVLSASRPQRIIFDPVTQLFSGDAGAADSHIEEFARWAASFAATVLLVAGANGRHQNVIEQLTALVRESFRFDVAETENRVTRLFAFEKSRALAEQPIEVDPTRGIFLLARPPQPAPPSQPTVLHLAHAVREKSAPAKPSKASPTTQEVMPATTPVTAPAAVTTPAVIAGIQAPAAVAVSGAETAAANNSILELDGLDFSGLTPAAVHADAKAQNTKDLLSKDAGVKPPDGDLSLSAKMAFTPPLIEAMAPPAKVRLPVENRPLSTVTPVAPPAAPIVTSFNDFLEELDAAIAAIDLGGEKPYAQGVVAPALPNPPPADWQKSETLSASQSELAINPKDFHIVIIGEDAALREQTARLLGDYTVESVEEMVTGIARIMASNPDLVILDLDMPIIDGFKVLTQLRASLNAPIILLTKTLVRASDRIYAAELGADYYLTKPFSQKELKQKARQLIARFRGINSWLLAPTQTGGAKPAIAAASSNAHASMDAAPRTELAEIVNLFPERRANFNRALKRARKYQIEPYEQFIVQVEANVKLAVEKGTAFSIIGCHLESGSRNADREAVEFFRNINPLVRTSDLISTNAQNELLILLPETNVKGARAFIKRLRESLRESLRQNLTVWMRSFPGMEEESESFSASA